MRGTRTYIALVASLLFNIVGVPGLVEDAKTWAGWLGMTSPEWYWVNYVLVSLGGLAFLYAAFPTVQRLARQIRSGSTTLSSQRGTQKEERIYTERKVGELFAALPNLTSVRAEQYLRPHIGKWMPIQNTIVDIAEDGQYIDVVLGEKFGPYVSLRFDKKLWAANIETMDRGDRLSAEGKIRHVDVMQMHLVDCSITARKEKDDTLRHSSESRPN